MMEFNKSQSVVIVLYCLLIRICIAVTEVAVEHAYWERLNKAKFGVLFGLVLAIVTPIFLWIAEKQLVRYEQLVRSCRQAVRKVKNPDVIFPQYQSRPIYVCGNTSTDCPRIKDNDLGYVADVSSIRMRRIVELYQWQESKRDKDNGKRTVYSYHKTWSEYDIDSSTFHDPSHRNPRRQPDAYSTIMNADVVKIGAYTLLDQQVDMLSSWEACSLHTVPSASRTGYNHLHPHIDTDTGVQRSVGWQDGGADSGLEGGGGGDYLVFKGTLDAPVVGTVRVKYDIIREGGLVTTIAVQEGTSFRAFTEDDAHQLSPFLSLENCCNRVESSERDTPSCCLCCGALTAYMDIAGSAVDTEVILVEERSIDTDSLFKCCQNRLLLRLILIRITSYLLLSLAAYLLLQPIAALLSTAPLLGPFMSYAVWGPALLIGSALGMFVSSLAWIMYRPLWLAGGRWMCVKMDVYI